jgi:hypothetical protein
VGHRSLLISLSSLNRSDYVVQDDSKKRYELPCIDRVMKCVGGCGLGSFCFCYATIDYINQGLKENQLCVYASVNAYDRSNLSTVSSKIKDYKENIDKR